MVIEEPSVSEKSRSSGGDRRVRLAPPPRETQASARRASPPACGTWQGYKRHLTLGEQPCEACAEASRARSRARYADPATGERQRRIDKHQAHIAALPPDQRPHRERSRGCERCGELFTTTRAAQRFCSTACRRRAQPDRRAPSRRTESWPATVRPLHGAPVARSVTVELLPLGGMWVLCPTCSDLMATVDADDPLQRRCVRCHLDVDVREDGDEWLATGSR